MSRRFILINIDEIKNITTDNLLKVIALTINEVVSIEFPEIKKRNDLTATSNRLSGYISDLTSNNLKEFCNTYNNLEMLINRNRYQNYFIIDHKNKNIYSINTISSVNTAKEQVEQRLAEGKSPHYISACSQVLNVRKQINTSSLGNQIALFDDLITPINLDKYDSTFSKIFPSRFNLVGYSFKVIEYASKSDRIIKLELAMYDGRMNCINRQSIENYIYANTVFSHNDNDYSEQNVTEKTDLSYEQTKISDTESVVTLKIIHTPGEGS